MKYFLAGTKLPMPARQDGGLWRWRVQTCPFPRGVKNNLNLLVSLPLLWVFTQSKWERALSVPKNAGRRGLYKTGLVGGS